MNCKRDVQAARYNDAMRDFNNQIFGKKSSYHPHFYLSQRVDIPCPPKHIMETFAFAAALLHDQVIEFLAPQDILGLWRCCRTAWTSLSPVERNIVMLRSVFRYLRISEEAAQQASNSFIGGLKALLPRLVQLCEALAVAYAPFEPDVTHRCFLAEHLCFSAQISQQQGRSTQNLVMGSLATYECRKARYGKSVGLATLVEPVPVPPSSILLENFLLTWGESGIYCKLKKILPEWLDHNRHWMQEHFDQMENPFYKDRLKRGLDPVVWIDFAYEPQPLYVGLAIGPHGEQFVVNFRPHHDLPLWSKRRADALESFFFCFNESYMANDSKGGLCQFLVRDSHQTNLKLGMCIWMMHHRIAPFDDINIDWNEIIDQACSGRGGALTQKVVAEYASLRQRIEGLSTLPTEDDNDGLVFYKRALKSSRYGSADVHKYTKMLLTLEFLE